MFERLINWLTLNDYDTAKAMAFRGVVDRYTRGNVAIQEGRYLTAADLKQLGKQDDKASANIRSFALFTR